MQQKPLGGTRWGSLSAPPRPLAAVKGLPPREGDGKRGEEGKEGRGEGKERKGRGREKECERREREGREKGTGRGPQFKKNDPPPVIRWLVTGLNTQYMWQYGSLICLCIFITHC